MNTVNLNLCSKFAEQGTGCNRETLLANCFARAKMRSFLLDPPIAILKLRIAAALVKVRQANLYVVCKSTFEK